MSDFRGVDARFGPGQRYAEWQDVSGHDAGERGVRFGDNVVVTADAVTRSDKDAQALVDVVHFLASMVQSDEEQDPTASTWRRCWACWY